MRQLSKHLILFLIGGSVYLCMELAFRGHSHWTMFVMGGILFLLIGAINEFIPWEMPLLEQGFLGAIIITGSEFIAGCILNLWLGLNVWDYSDVPLNIMGQICLPFSCMWVFVSMLAVVIDDLARWKLFCEDKPSYTLL